MKTIPLRTKEQAKELEEKFKPTQERINLDTIEKGKESKESGEIENLADSFLESLLGMVGNSIE
jgi:hypothetical protein